MRSRKASLRSSWTLAPSGTRLPGPWARCAWSRRTQRSVQRGSNSTHWARKNKFLVEALDATRPFDYEAKQMALLERQKLLKIGIVGFGNFGQFIADRFVKAGHTVLATSRTSYVDVASDMGVEFFTDVNDFAEEHPDVVVVCSSILSSETVIRSLPLQRFKRKTLFVDVLSVKEYPKKLMLKHLSPELDILCTHPMFGPDSGRDSWEGLKLMYDKVRIREGDREDVCERFLKIFRDEGCEMVEMTCEEHDKIAASTQFITHTVGRVLGKMGLETTPINTRGYDSLLNLVENTTHDSFDLYYGLFMYNKNATEEIDRLEHAFDSIRKQLFSELHGILRKEIFDDDSNANGKH